MSTTTVRPIEGTKVAIAPQPRDPNARTLVMQSDPTMYVRWTFAGMIEPYFTRDPAHAAYFETDSAAANAARDKDFTFMRN